MHKVILTSCFHFTGVDYYPALIMISCDMFTSISLSILRVSGILHGFCRACNISDVSQHIIETTLNIIPMKCIPQYQIFQVKDFL